MNEGRKPRPTVGNGAFATYRNKHSEDIPHIWWHNDTET